MTGRVFGGGGVRGGGSGVSGEGVVGGAAGLLFFDTMLA